MEMILWVAVIVAIVFLVATIKKNEARRKEDEH